jgi:hypothetical protein
MTASFTPNAILSDSFGMEAPFLSLAGQSRHTRRYHKNQAAQLQLQNHHHR